ncbi:Di-copper centre-containing protein [Mycena sanguinolenta]|uniref:Di-copper centre-containing protein n=1 Tax=Mycena sanguinolenta TaxID=230812 RepID=A0A8H7DID7_9AGAR|nr:Di-copper centre-containing protein [Mycena sanguinolenta]
MPQSLFNVYLVLILLFFPGGALGKTKCTDHFVRKEWRSLSREERKLWISGVKCLANTPSDGLFVPSVNPDDIAPYNTSGSLFDDIVYAHMDLNHRIHWTGLFFPWHRWYLHLFEKALRTRCGYPGAIPYWDWTQDAGNFYESSFFKDSDPDSGLGGWGDASTGYRVLDGAFSASSSFQVSYPVPHTIRRNFTLFPSFPIPAVWNHTRPANVTFTKSVVESLIDGFVGDFKGFNGYMEGIDGPHLNVHFLMGGDVSGACPSDAPAGCQPGPTFAPNGQVSGAPQLIFTYLSLDPLFFLHHAMVDRTWFKWQQKHNNKYAFEGGSVQRLANASEFALYPNGGPPYLSLESEIPTDGLSPGFVAEINDSPYLMMESEIPTDGLSSGFTVAEMMDTMEEPLCYVYD